MQYIMTIIWAILISAAVSYVLLSMAGEPFVFADSLLLAVILVVAVFILGAGVLKDKKE